MNRLIAIAVLGTLIACGGSTESPLAPSSTTPNDASINGAGTSAGVVYTGHGIAVDATVQGSNTKLCDTGKLPRAGGRIEQTMAGPSISGLLNASSLYCITVSLGKKGITEATVFGLNLTVGGNTIQADRVHSMSGAQCPPITAVPASTGSAFVTNLRINGKVVNVKASTQNQKFELPNGFVAFNEHTSFFTAWHAGRTVTGLRVVINKPEGAAEVILARALTHIDCP
jgi:hypothetical protein